MRKLVLIVESDLSTAQEIQTMLQLQSYETTYAENGKDAINILRTEPPPSVMLVNILMPEMDGWELLTEMSKDELLAHIPVVVITATQSDPALGKGNIVGFISRPFREENLVAVVEKAFQTWNKPEEKTAATMVASKENPIPEKPDNGATFRVPAQAGDHIIIEGPQPAKPLESPD